jgi:YD repeat-containing protein
VTVDRCDASDTSCITAITQNKFYYDGFGRLTQSKTRMPDAQWSLAKKELDGLGRMLYSYQPEYRSDGSYDSTTPAKSTQYTYDFLGRVTSTTLPDGSSVTQAYNGAQQMDRTTYNSGGGVTSGGNTVTETYDGHGRLVGVTEPSASSGGSITTAYRYDGANRLIQVESSTQTRKFRYDDRGFLLGETHPELTVEKTFLLFDARGHAHHIEIAGSSSLDFVFDPAERPSTISSGGSLLKEFYYGSQSASFNRQGRLDYAIRHNTVNDTSIQGVVTPRDVTVKDQYKYDAPGRIVEKATTLSNSGGSPDQLLTQTYGRDSLGNVTDLVYPTVGTAHSLDVVYGYDNGLLRSVGPSSGLSFTGNSTAAYITYHPTGMVHQIPHGGYDQTTDVITPDSMMARPSSIEFDGFASCQVVQPDVYVNSTICPSSTTWVTVAQADATTYAWQVTGGQPVSGANTNQFTFLANASGNVYLTLTLTNACGTRTFHLDPIPIGASSGTLTAQGQPPSSTMLTLTLSGTYPYSLTWSDGTPDYLSNTSTATHSVNPTVTTDYNVSITDGNGCTSTSNTVRVTVAAISPPSSVTATATAANQVKVEWPLVSGATSYVVYRDNVQVGAPGTSPFYDNGVTGGVAYIYKVHAKNASTESVDSPIDLATTVVFNDDPYLRIRQFDITSLRAAVNAVRVRAGIGPYTFTDCDTCLSGHFIRGVYFQELRNVLNPGRQALGLPALTFSDSNIDPAANGGQHFPIKRIYVMELRGGVQ